MLNNHFYHAAIRRTIAAFGSIFNDIKVVRTDADGEVKQITRVPLAYGPRQKFLARLEEQQDILAPAVAIKLPRMSFEITSLIYDSTSKLNKMNKITRAVIGDPTSKSVVYTCAPYKMGIQLSIMAKNQDDALQVIEQIMPYFQPEYTITINEIPEMNIKGDVPIVLNGVTLSDDYTGDFMTRRAIVYSLDFELRVRFYGPVKTQSIITQSSVDINDGDTFGFLEEVTANGTVDPIVLGIDEVDNNIKD
tara:strand:- start:2522 stop:3268 length:747 start_codon:yes stop_codon:yes gene_type:complete